MPVHKLPTCDFYGNPSPEEFIRMLHKDLEIKSILDVGSGHGGVFDKEFWDGQRMNRRTACDIFWVRDCGPGWEMREGVDACNLVESFGRGSFEMVQCFETLEHISDSRKALEQLCDVATKLVVITSADETQHTGPEQERIEKVNKHQKYIGQPKVKDLKSLGFDVRVEVRQKRQLIAWNYL